MIIERHCDGPDHHLQRVDEYRASSMDGAPCSAVRGCPGRVRAHSPIAEVKEPKSYRAHGAATGLMFLVPIGMVMAIILSFRPRTESAQASVAPEIVIESSSDTASPGLEPESPIEPADRGSMNLADLAQPELGKGSSSTENTAVESESTRSDASAERTALVETVASDQVVPASEEVSLPALWRIARDHRNDPRIYLVIAGLALAIVLRQPRVVIFGAVSAFLMALLGLQLSSWFQAQMRFGATDTLGFGKLLRHPEPSVLWGCAIGFLCGAVQFIRWPKSRSSNRRRTRREVP